MTWKLIIDLVLLFSIPSASHLSSSKSSSVLCIFTYAHDDAWKQ